MMVPVFTMDRRIFRLRKFGAAKSTAAPTTKKRANQADMRVFAGETVNMSKAKVRSLHFEVSWPSMQGLILLIYSWMADNDSILSDTVELKNVDSRKFPIPDGYTGGIQPLDGGTASSNANVSFVT